MNATSRLTLNKEGMAFDPMTGASYLISPTGLAIIEHWQAGRDDVAAADRLSAAYNIELKTAARDITDFRAQLRVLQLND